MVARYVLMFIRGGILRIGSMWFDKANERSWDRKKLKCLNRIGLNIGSVDSKNARKQERWKSTGMD
jgi:hypothetical protein